MKVIGLQVREIAEEMAGLRRVVTLLGAEIWFTADDVVSVEDVPDPLPTEPGTRFWGKTFDTEPQWWFSRAMKGEGATLYAPMIGWQLTDCQAERDGLVRLPDPDGAS